MTRRACLDGKYLITPQPTAQMKQAQTLEIRKKAIESLKQNENKLTVSWTI